LCWRFGLFALRPAAKAALDDQLARNRVGEGRPARRQLWFSLRGSIDRRRFGSCCDEFELIGGQRQC